MNEVFASLIRQALLKLALFLLKIVSGSFEFKGVSYDKTSDELLVRFIHKYTEQFETIDVFIHSDFFYLLSKKEIDEVIQAKLAYTAQHKAISIKQDEDFPELFTIHNTNKKQTTEGLAKDIFNNDYYLENMHAKDIRIITQTALHLHLTDTQPETTETIVSEGQSSKIIPIKRNNNEKKT